MQKTYLILLLILTIVFFGCANRYYCDLGQYANSTPSRVLRFEKVTMLDTIPGNLSGRITGIDSSKKKVETYILIYANITARDNLTGKTYETVSDFEGEYDFFIPASKYDLSISYTAMDIFVLKDVIINPGDKYVLDVILGQGSDSTIFQVLQDGSITNLNNYKPKISN